MSSEFLHRRLALPRRRPSHMGSACRGGRNADRRLVRIAGIYILVPFWREAFGVSLASASLAVTVMNGVQIATMFTLGRAIDIHGERRIVGIAMLGMAIAMACAATFANSLPALLVCIAFLGGTYAAVQPGGTRAIMRWFPPAKRGIATGFRQAAVPFGTMIAAALLPFMAVRYGWHAAA